jgi:ABC-type lipoprotein release transport system permease subunit
MGLVFNLSVRNLFRQKRRNLFLGIGIGFGMLVLTVASSFSHGMVDVLVNDIVGYAYGNLVIEGFAGDNSFKIIRDYPRIKQIINKTIKKEDLRSNINQNVGIYARAVGNGEADNVYIVGVSARTKAEREKLFKNFFTIINGGLAELSNSKFEYPIVISKEKAESLNVKVHDYLRVRLPMVTGQIQAARLTVVAIANSNNTFMNNVLFMDTERIKNLLGYKPWESASIQISLKDPEKKSKYYAELLRPKLKPEILSISGKTGIYDCVLFAYQDNQTSQNILTRNLRFANDFKNNQNTNGIWISRELARKLRLEKGDKFDFRYQTKYRGVHQETFMVNGIFENDNRLPRDTILVNEKQILDNYNRFIPGKTILVNSKVNPLYHAFATEWKLLPKSKDSQSLQKKYNEERRVATKQTKLDVVTMYEGASYIMQLESVLGLVTFSAVLMLFFIILIGVVNTLRITIKERTREIGTVRAIGMQKNDVRNMFITETLALTTISCICGFILGIVVMRLLELIHFDVNNVLSVILKDKHLFFKLNPIALLGNFVLIIIISVITAFFPAKRAAKLIVVTALQNYE